MDVYQFDPDMTFTYVRKTVEEINLPRNKNLVARFTWLEGNSKDLSVPFLYDEMAERFGHMIDKSALHTEILYSLYNAIPVEVRLSPRPHRGED